MANIKPFRAWRYNLAQVGDLSDVTGPAAEQLDKDTQDELYKRHPCNVVRLEFNRAEPWDQNPTERLQRAASFVRHWLTDEILIQDHDEAIYVYNQIFEIDGEEVQRNGFIVLLELDSENLDSSHPETSSDNVEQLSQCRFNFAPVVGVYADDALIQESLEDAVISETALEATDTCGVISRISAMTDRTIINDVKDSLKTKSVVIVQGLERYRAAVDYHHRCTASEPVPASNLIMALLIARESTGLMTAEGLDEIALGKAESVTCASSGITLDPPPVAGLVFRSFCE